MSSSDEIVFLVSQPRSGSTLLQRILGSHSAVCTRSEGWVLLRHLFGIGRESNGLTAPYNAEVAEQATREFLEWVPGGRESYYEAVNRMFVPLFGSILEREKRSVYLDKTPRYYEIVRELERAFPKARFVLLYRNPLAVCHSIWSTFAKEDWGAMRSFRRDLFDAPRLLIDAKDALGAKAHVVVYERMVKDPEPVIREIVRFLELEYEPAMIEYGKGGVEKWRWGDPLRVYEHVKPSMDSIELWRNGLKDPQFWRACSDYLQELGRDVFSKLGQNYEALVSIVEAAQPRAIDRALTVPLRAMLDQDGPKSVEMRHRIISKLGPIVWSRRATAAPESV